MCPESGAGWSPGARGGGMILSIAEALGARAIRATRSIGEMGLFLGASLRESAASADCESP